LNVKHRVGDITLREHVLILMEFQYLLSRAHFGEKVFRVKHVLVWLHHGNLLWLDQISSNFSAPNCYRASSGNKQLFKCNAYSARLPPNDVTVLIAVLDIDDKIE
jgi:hypothetical protein